MKLRIYRCRIAAAFATVAGICLLVGCASKGSKQMHVLKEGDRFYDAYLNGDVDTARSNLDQAIQFFKSPRADILEPSGRAGILYFTYARLYALEKRTGNDSAAAAALTTARSWNEKRYQLGGETNSMSLEECRVFDKPEKIVEVADRLDSAATNGKGPKYNHSTHK